MTTDSDSRLSPAAAYRLWAPTYRVETVVSALEERVVRALMPSLEGRRLLDVGCGVARRLRATGDKPDLMVGLDLVLEMLLAAGKGEPRLRVVGDARRLPFAEASFDLVWCRLVLGHLEDLAMSYAELTRVCSVPAMLIVSDFHPAAVAAGHSRSFRDEAGNRHEIEHYVHEATGHEQAASICGWKLTARVDAPAGAPERAFYDEAGRIDQFQAESDLPLVLVMCFER